MNITEAFKALDALNEDTFSISDDGINKLSEFEQNDDLLDEIPVIDADAETEDDLEDSYVGKVILDCTVCHSKIYKDKDDITLDENEEFANVGEECPYCYTSDGFKVIGEVTAFDGDESDDDNVSDGDKEAKDTEDKETDEGNETDSEESDEDVNESLEKPLTEAANPDNEETNSLIRSITGGGNKRFARAKKDLKKQGYELEVDSEARKSFGRDYFGDSITISNPKTGRKITGNVNNRWSGNDTLAAVTDSPNNTKARHTIKNKFGAKIPQAVAKDFDYKGYLDTDRPFEPEKKTTVQQYKDDKQFIKDNEYTLRKGKEAEGRLDDVKSRLQQFRDKKGTTEESLTEAPVATLERPMSELGGTLSNVLTAHKDQLSEVGNKAEAIDFLNSIEPEVKNKGYLRRVMSQLTKIPEYKVSMFLYNIILKGDGMGTMEGLNEDVNKVNVETDDTVVNVETADDGKVTVTTEPKDSTEEVATEGAETIVPLSDETEQDIINGPTEPAEDEFVEDDVDMSEFDEDSFSELGESYLKSIYENVESFKVSDVAANDTKIKLEGVIKFTSGNEKKTSFLFESVDIDTNNKVRFIGENTNITRGKKAFTLKGQINEGKFISESFNYNYRAKNADGKSTRVYGTVRTNKGE